MTDLKKLRKLAEIAARHNGYGVFTTDECQNFSDAANPQAIIEILDMLERLEWIAKQYTAYGSDFCPGCGTGRITLFVANNKCVSCDPESYRNPFDKREALEGGK